MAAVMTEIDPISLEDRYWKSIQTRDAEAVAELAEAGAGCRVAGLRVWLGRSHAVEVRPADPLELRVDNVVFRAGWGASRAQARQFVRHGHVAVNGRRVTIPSYTVRKGDVVTLRDKARSMIVVRHNSDTLDRQTPTWLETGEGGLQVTVRELPARAQIDVPVREQLIVELYSK